MANTSPIKKMASDILISRVLENTLPGYPATFGGYFTDLAKPKTGSPMRTIRERATSMLETLQMLATENITEASEELIDQLNKGEFLINTEIVKLNGKAADLEQLINSTHNSKGSDKGAVGQAESKNKGDPLAKLLRDISLSPDQSAISAPPLNQYTQMARAIETIKDKYSNLIKEVEKLPAAAKSKSGGKGIG
jgi:hypothetical protein